MKILLIFFTFYLISAKVRCFTVTGYSGGSLLLDSGKPWFSDSDKYMAKQYPRRTIINSKKHYKWINEGRFTLFKNNEGLLMIYIRDLNKHDAGRYWIDVEHFWSISMVLDVKEDSCCKVSKRVMVNVGETASFSCEYSQNHINDDKIIFKEEKASIEMIYNRWKKKERFSISDKKNKNVFSVKITAVTPDDGGVYLCGVWINRRSYSYSVINTVHLHISTKVGVSRASSYSGSGLMIKCEHPQYKTRPKYICKESDGCSEKKNPEVQNERMKNGDVSLYDDTRAGVLMVFFRELKAADEGTYRCGVKVSDYTEIFTELQLRLRHDVKYPKSVTESVYLHGKVNFTCQIPEAYEVLFCKEDDNHTYNHMCRNISSSKVTHMSGSSERNEERVFTVSISNVSVRDAGVYWCGAETRDTYLTFISLTTKIQLNLIMPPVVRREGESAEIICPYDSIYKSKPKSLCKGKCSTRDRNENETKTDRLTLKDDVSTSVFTGTITGLTAEDAGKYWCAVTSETELNYLYTHLMVIVNEELNLTKYEGDDVSIQCKHHDEEQKSFCKAHQASVCVKDGVSLETVRDDRFSFSDEASAGVFTVNITDLREEDSGIYWCGAHAITEVNLEVKKTGFTGLCSPGVSDRIIVFCVCVTLLLMGASVLFFYKYIKTRDPHPLTDRTETSSGEASHAACDYENIRDVRQRSLSGTEETVLYSTVAHPTDSSDPHDTLYSTVQLPTNPSDGLLYASVRFQKHKESFGDSQVGFNNEELYSQYSTVSRST
ncbi:polymeric immunoglobulin receptor-like isoform X2 [Puntigrus tetrazona]|uniref:polymeric immunoglobulin receptor-like isoform X1 n=1 Tax=Puntigrus tetrazona TaxID=1606681 RepID=UPI001C8972DF|nr:polymeric immunoglobulin receptor-like isoform X1 [Puntigrus tetrazona]XP_043098377.1 polymeric immunoglobulin receptor-like isoform X2 [Puntigrus tetrazona]